MTEKEKMLNGDPYNSRDPELIAMYHRARGLLSEYNQLDSQNLSRREELLDDLLGSLGSEVWIEAPFFCDYGENISIGDGSFVNVNCFFLDNNTITIGKSALIAPYVQIYTAGHPLRAAERVKTPEEARRTGISYHTETKPVIIGDHVWIGGNAVIMPGVTIGDGVTIGAGSVVTKNIPDHVLAVGNPCLVIKDIK